MGSIDVNTYFVHFKEKFRRNEDSRMFSIGGGDPNSGSAMRLSLDTETHCEEQERAWKMMSSITTIRYFLSAHTQRVQTEKESQNYVYMCVCPLLYPHPPPVLPIQYNP